MQVRVPIRRLIPPTFCDISTDFIQDQKTTSVVPLWPSFARVWWHQRSPSRTVHLAFSLAACVLSRFGEIVSFHSTDFSLVQTWRWTAPVGRGPSCGDALGSWRCAGGLVAEVGGELTHPHVDGLFPDLGRVEVCLALPVGGDDGHGQDQLDHGVASRPAGEPPQPRHVGGLEVAEPLLLRALELIRSEGDMTLDLAQHPRSRASRVGSATGTPRRP